MAAGRAAAPRVASWAWEWVTKLPLGFQCAADPGGSPAAVPMRAPRRREFSLAPVGIAAAANCPLPKCASETLRVGVALTRARAARAGAPGGVRATPPGARLHAAPTSNIGDGGQFALPLVFSPSAKFAQVRIAAEPPAARVAALPVAAAARGSPSRQRRAARGREGQPLPASAVILQDGRRRLDANAQEARP
jgi:hypothetical protein